ncbi:glycosyltransferase [Macrococcus capreoli]|uniref:glycosyltransferase n=1 Tax=Macrococcus capreoli TaxID=2982690 RepID=UPI003F43F76A
MKIAIIVSSNIVKDPRIVKQAEIVKNITDDYIVIGKWDINASTERLNKLNFKFNLIKITEGKNIIGKLVSRLNYGYRLCKELKKYNPEIIHANDFDMLFFAYFIKKRNQKLIYDAHEIYSQNGLIAKNKNISKIVMYIEKYMLKKVNTFITVSNAAREYYISKSYKIEPVVITNAPIKKSIQVNEKYKNFNVLYQGIVSPNRGYEEFAESALYTNSDLTIRGYGPTMDEIITLKKNKKLDNLIIDNPVEMDEMIDMASKSHVGVVLTKPISVNYEYTISNKIFEYLHAGIPVILSPVKEHLYLNNIYDFGIVIEDVSPKLIAEAINKFKNDNELYELKKNNALAASQKLTWQNESQKLIAIYKDALNE